MASLQTMRGEWEDLWNRVPGTITFQRPDWILVWIQTFCPREPFLLTVRKNGKLIAVAPFIFYERYSNHGQRERVLGLMGGGVSDYLDILIDPGHIQEAMAALWDKIYAVESRWDVVEFTDLAPSSCLLPTADWLLKSAVQKHDYCSFISLPTKSENLKCVIPPHKWENVRNARNRLQRAGGGTIEIANENTLDAALDGLFQLHRARWAQECLPGVLREESVRNFHRRIAPALLKKDVLRLHTLRVNGSCIASAYSFFEGEQTLCYLHGYDPQYAHLSPGTLIIAAVIEDAMRAEKKAVNFLRGQEEYKKSWGVRQENTFCLRVESRSRVRPGILAA
jgi:CelD/BcsL family acetyltransferase involved in cellulose biosynthesis